jgi:hypothetical protein
MFKRTLGYLLLTMLVLTGLAGRMHTDILSGKERRILVNELKSSRTALVLSTTGLSRKQLNFRSGKNKPTIRELIYRLASIDHSLRQINESIMQAEKHHQKLNVVKDEMLDSIAAEVVKDPDLLLVDCLSFKSMEDALASYKESSTELLRYARTTTENVRGHRIHTPAGDFDAYQVMLLTGACTVYCIEEMEAIRKTPNFPK